MNGKGTSRLRPILASLALIALALFPMCSDSGVTPLPDSIDPGEGQISLETPEVMFYPQDKRENVVTNTTIELYFSVEMDRDSEEWIVRVSGTDYRRSSFVQDPWVGRALVIRPADPFSQGVPVTVEARGFVSEAGMPMPDTGIIFTTVIYSEPTVTITPALVTAASGGTAAHPLSDVKLEFSQLVLSDNGWSVTINDIPFTRSDRASWNNTVLTINPADYFTPGSQVKIEAKGFATAYGAMTVPETSGSFEVDATALPTIAFDPSASADPVSRLVPLTLSFSENVIQDGDWEVVLDGVSYTKDSPDIRWVDGGLCIDHSDAPLAEGFQVTAQAMGFVAVDGYPFENAGVTFPVKPKPVITGSPAQDQLNVSIKTPITLAFDEPVNRNGAWQVTIDGTVYSTSLNSAACAWESDRKLVIDHSPDFTLGQTVHVTASGFQTSAFPVAFDDLDYYFTPTVIPVDDVNLYNHELEIVEGEDASLVAEIIPSNATTTSVKWKSLDENVATVDEYGKVSGVKKGITEIRVITDDGGHIDTCTVTVLAPREVGVYRQDMTPIPQGIYAFPDTRVGMSSDRAAFVIKNNGDKDLVIYGVESSQPSLFTVDPTGMSTIILGGGETVEFGVTFAPPVDLPLGMYDAAIIITSDDPDQPEYSFTVNGEAIKSPRIIGNPGPNQSGVHITSSVVLSFTEAAKHDGTVEITSGGTIVDFTQTWSPDSKSLTIDPVPDFVQDQEVRVIASGFTTVADADPIEFEDLDYVFTPIKVPVTGITLNPTVAAIDLNNATTLQLSATVEPGDATYRDVTWASSEINIASVNVGGLVTGNSTGDAVISVSVNDNPAVAATCRIIVQKTGDPGYKEIITIDDISFITAHVPTGIDFPTGIDDKGIENVTAAIQLGETEVTYEQWTAVYVWATDSARGIKKFYFANAGYPGGGSGNTMKDPVTMINWRDAMVWCNAFTEFYNDLNDPDLTCVYTYNNSIIRDSRDSNATACDNMVMDALANGFRLPSSRQWEYAARWRNEYHVNTVPGYSNPWFTKGDSLSHATANYTNNIPSSDVGIFYEYYSGGTTGVSGTSPVGSKIPNSLGLYDMSGNVWEWCSNWHEVGSTRVIRGGSWCNKADMLRIGVVNSWQPNDENPYIGFRVVKKKQ